MRPWTTKRRRAIRLGVVAAVVTALSAVTMSAASAHGSTSSPASRTYNCWKEGAEHPQSAACKAAIALGTTQPVYDWNEVNIANANGHHRELIPDGKLCSAGRDKYKGFDLPRADWVATPMTAGPQTFKYAYTAARPGTFELYLTKQGYDP